MLKLVRTLALAAAMLGGGCTAQAQTTPAPEVAIEDAAWLAGRWA